MMRQVNEAGLALIKSFEGFSPVVYADVVGKATIGYGHLVREDEHFGVLSEKEAETLLQHDLRSACFAVERFIHVPLSDNQFSALVSFTFNLGSGALQRSTLRQQINRGAEQASIVTQWRRWVWAGGRRWSGLRRRREAEIILYFQ